MNLQENIQRIRSMMGLLKEEDQEKEIILIEYSPHWFPKACFENDEQKAQPMVQQSSRLNHPSSKIATIH